MDENWIKDGHGMDEGEWRNGPHIILEPTRSVSPNSMGPIQLSG
jgi:hypothetical protein